MNDLYRRPHVRSYDQSLFPFSTAARDLFGVAHDLSLLREVHPLFDRARDQSTDLHQRFYARWEDSWLAELYRRFIELWIEPLFGEPVVFQRVPTFRVHLPGNVAVGTVHRDFEFGHRSPELNFWLPFTSARASSSVHIELEGQLTPFPVEEGEVLVFDGVNLRHGNVVNETGATRLSIDFRCMPAARFIPRAASTVNGVMTFQLGSYFDRL